MGEIKNFIKEKLVIGILTTVPWNLSKVYNVLEKDFGEIDYKSSLLDFVYTDYYIPEMGHDIKRCFISFRDLVEPSDLSDIKVKTNEIETIFSIENNRKMNLDPGLLSLERFMLATTKNNGHRVPLLKGIYAEITLLFVNKKFQNLPWTYADYRSTEYQDILLSIRSLYKKNLKQGMKN